MKAGILSILFLLCACAGMTPEEETMQKEWARQLAPEFEKLPATWKGLQEMGVTSETRLILDFQYSIPTEQDAHKFSSMLHEKFGYDVQVSETQGSKAWSVQGRTVWTTVTLEILKKWVSYMVQAGVESGGRFEGWGAKQLSFGG